VLGVRIIVWTSILVFAGAIVYFVLARKRGPREEPETLRGKDYVEVQPAEPTNESEPAEVSVTAESDKALPGDDPKPEDEK
jgi:hypothetical protein